MFDHFTDIRHYRVYHVNAPWISLDQVVQISWMKLLNFPEKLRSESPWGCDTSMYFIAKWFQRVQQHLKHLVLNIQYLVPFCFHIEKAFSSGTFFSKTYFHIPCRTCLVFLETIKSFSGLFFSIFVNSITTTRFNHLFL